MSWFNNKRKQDELSIAMQKEIINIAAARLGKPLPVHLIAKVSERNWSYMGLEMIMDTVRTMEPNEIENYLANLE